MRIISGVQNDETPVERVLYIYLRASSFPVRRYASLVFEPMAARQGKTHIISPILAICMQYYLQVPFRFVRYTHLLYRCYLKLLYLQIRIYYIIYE